MSVRRKSFREGEESSDFTASDYNDIAQEIEKLANLSAFAPLLITSNEDSRIIDLSMGPPFYARLTSNASPYSWEEVIFQPGNTIVDGTREGTANAYEVNGARGLFNEFVLLRPTVVTESGVPEYRFQFIRYGPCTTQICVHVINGCTSGPLEGATVTVTQNGTVVGTGTTDSSGNVCIPVPQAGGTFTVTVVSGLNTVTQPVTVASCETANITVTLTPKAPLHPVCANVYGCGADSRFVLGQQPALPLATVTLNGPGGVVGTQTTDRTGRVCFTVTTPGNYTMTVTANGYVSQSQSFPFTVCSEIGLAFFMKVRPDYGCCLGWQNLYFPLAFTLAVPFNLSLQDSNGVWPLTNTGSLTWSLCYSFTSQNVFTCVPGSLVPIGNTASITVQYGIGCTFVHDDPTTIAFEVTMFWVFAVYGGANRPLPFPSPIDQPCGALLWTAGADCNPFLSPPLPDCDPNARIDPVFRRMTYFSQTGQSTIIVPGSTVNFDPFDMHGVLPPEPFVNQTGFTAPYCTNGGYQPPMPTDGSFAIFQ